MKIGAYMPITGGLSRAITHMHANGGNCIMVYTRSPKSFGSPAINVGEILRAKEVKANLGFGETVIHAPYIINPANPEVGKRNTAIGILSDEIKRTEAFGSKLMVMHPGSAMGTGAYPGIERLAGVLNVLTDTASDVTICVETMAGKGTEIMSRLEHFEYLFKILDHPERVGVCLDTCHMHDSGYDFSPEGIDTTMAEIEKYIGFNKVKVIHVNGSMNERGTHKDRHACIGSTQDKIGVEGLRKFCQRPEFADIPKILETPWVGDRNNYANEIALLSSSLES